MYLGVVIIIMCIEYKASILVSSPENRVLQRNRILQRNKRNRTSIEREREREKMRERKRETDLKEQAYTMWGLASPRFAG